MAQKHVKPVVFVQSHCDGSAYSRTILRAAAIRYLKILKQTAELSIVIVDDAEIQALNKMWRGKNKPTDVLSFEQTGDQGLLGDVVISLETARKQAHEANWSLKNELERLLAHGLLHLLGHDHILPADAVKMAQAEIALLGEDGMVADAQPKKQHPASLQFRRFHKTTG